MGGHFFHVIRHRIGFFGETGETNGEEKARGEPGGDLFD